MSLVNLANVCSHIQNASKARLGITSIPMSKLHLRLALSLQKQGFVSTVKVAGLAPPHPNPPKPHPHGFQTATAAELEEAPWRAYPDPDPSFAHMSGIQPERIPENPAQRRIWLGLKYWNSEPVLRKMSLISKPTRRIVMDSEGIGKISRGVHSGYVRGLANPGECMFVSTDRGLMESRECAEKNIGGLLLCKVE